MAFKKRVLTQKGMYDILFNSDSDNSDINEEAYFGPWHDKTNYA